MRGFAIALCAVALTGCSNASGPSMLTTVWEQVKASREDRPKPVKKTLPRSEIDRLNVAMIQMNLEGEAAWPLMLPAGRNGPHVTYANKLRQSLILNESQIVATRGLGTDMIAAESGANDPLKSLTPPADWPQTVTRAYRFAGAGPAGREMRFTCTLARAGAASITLAGTPIPVIGFQETCTGAEGTFQNRYAADQTTGRVWKSQQFVGFDIAPVNLDILEPLTE